MSALGLLHPPRIIGSLHDLGCAGPEACDCTPIYVVSGDRAGDEQPVVELEAEAKDAP